MKCSPILSRYVDIFNGFVHQGSALKKHKHINPTPHNPNAQHFRDTNRQNDWIRENLFDPLGNYLFCSKCVCAAFKISKERLSQQRRIKRESSQDPIVDMTKDRVENERLGDFIVMPTSVEFPFLTWWWYLYQEHTVQVRYPYQ